MGNQLFGPMVGDQGDRIEVEVGFDQSRRDRVAG
jgi:hypothetical protein